MKVSTEYPEIGWVSTEYLNWVSTEYLGLGKHEHGVPRMG